MENFIVSARKYRPATFDMVIGQDYITNTLKSAIKNKHLTQSYLFCGPRGVGKTTCARILAKTINCSNLNENAEACDMCESCLSFNKLRSFNIHELDAASNNKVDDIRNLTDQVRVPPQVGKYSIYIIDEVHMLSSSAFNAFLKTLEEPPAHAVFILATTEKHKIIPTILSRCQIFDFNRIRIEDIVSRITYVAKNESVKAEEEALHIIAQKADGSLRDALSIFDQIVSFSGKTITYKDVIENLNVLDYEYYFRTVENALEGDISKVLMTFNEVLEKGFDGHNFVSGLNSHLRDILVSKDEVTLRLLEASPNIRQKYLQQAQNCPVDFLYQALEIGSVCDLAYKGSKNQRLHVELSLLKLCRLSSGIGMITGKKKLKSGRLTEQPDELPLPSRSEIIRQSASLTGKNENHADSVTRQTDIVKEKDSKTFSIKDIIAEDSGSYEKDSSLMEKPGANYPDSAKKELDVHSFLSAWKDFAEEVKTDSPRVASMFKSVKPEIRGVNTIVLHLSNATQKEMFLNNYKQRLSDFLKKRFNAGGIEFETVIDLSEANEILYSDEQKYNHLATKYPVIKDIKKAFNLDFE